MLLQRGKVNSKTGLVFLPVWGFPRPQSGPQVARPGVFILGVGTVSVHCGHGHQARPGQVYYSAEEDLEV